MHACFFPQCLARSMHLERRLALVQLFSALSLPSENRNPHWPAGRHNGDAEPQSESAGDPVTGAQASGSQPSPDAAAARPADDDVAAAAGGDAARGRPDEAAEMAAHFRRVQELFGGGSGQQVAALARQLRTAVDVESIRARLQCAGRPLRRPLSVCQLHAMRPTLWFIGKCCAGMPPGRIIPTCCKTMHRRVAQVGLAAFAWHGLGPSEPEIW